MKLDFNVKLTTIPEVQDFVQIASSCPYSVIVSHGRFVVDGTSLLGLFSLDLSNPVKVTIENDSPTVDKGIFDRFAPYIVDEKI